MNCRCFAKSEGLENGLISATALSEGQLLLRGETSWHVGKATGGMASSPPQRPLQIPQGVRMLITSNMSASPLCAQCLL